MISIATIKHQDHRYPTVGDWYWSGEDLYVAVSKCNQDAEFLVGLHEMIEAYLCKKRGIKENDVTEFDLEYERNRKKGDLSEPGNHKKAPYRKEHKFATRIEKLVCKELGVNWTKYEKIINSL